MLNPLNLIGKYLKNQEISAIREEFIALKTDIHLFKTEVLTEMCEKMDKLSKKLALRTKRAKEKEELEGEKDINKVLLPFDDGIFKQA
tara:strand:- start:1283 stop:1546 length:264 start_codon:yes stop_codon:yes gene_type:complete